MSNRLTKCKPADLLGLRVTIKFPESTAQVVYERDGTMRWIVTDNEGKVTSGNDRVAMMQIAGALYLLNWRDKIGFFVTQFIDLERGSVKACWSYQEGDRHRLSSFVAGDIEIKGHAN